MNGAITLDEIGLKHGTDKSSAHHDYLRFYEAFFSPLRDAEISILEIGVLNGASLRTWEEYFPNARIAGVDILPLAKRFETERIKIEILDQSDIEQLTQLALQHGPLDLVVEDGSHMWEHQTTSLRTLFPFVRKGGIYIVEDLQTNYGMLSAQYKGIARASCVDFLKSWTDLLVGAEEVRLDQVEDAFLRTYGRAVQQITFYRHACLVKKGAPTRGQNSRTPAISTTGTADAPGVRILAHVSDVGDVSSTNGSINSGHPEATVQGILIDFEQDIFEYRVRWGKELWSEWVGTGQFAGTRGQSLGLTGFAVRLRPEAKARFNLQVGGLFSGVGNAVQVEDGEDCTPPRFGALYAMQIELAPR